MDDQPKVAATVGQEFPTWERLEDQIAWYDQKSQASQRRYKRLKLAQVFIAGLIPLAALFSIPIDYFKLITAILGLLVLIIEALQQLNQYQQNWISYRSTCEALKHEKYLYLAAAGPYGIAEDQRKRIAVLADRIEGLISQEHAKWVSAQEQSLAAKKDKGLQAAQVGKGKGDSQN